MPVAIDKYPYKAIRALLIKHEGIRNKPYTDTMGKLTIGVGRNLTDVGLSEEEIAFMLDNDLKACRMSCVMKLPWFTSLDEVRQAVVINMVFNMGIVKFYGFSKLISFLETGLFEQAAHEMLNSQWASEVPSRANELYAMMATGSYPMGLTK